MDTIECLEFALEILKERRTRTPGLGAPIALIKEALENLKTNTAMVKDDNGYSPNNW